MFRSTFTFLVLVFFSLGHVPGAALADDLSGRKVMEMVKDKHEKPVEFSVSEMVLIDSSGEESNRLMNSYSRKFDGELFKTLLTFKSPAGVKGVANLNWEKEDGDDDQWTFLPGLGKLKRVVGGGKRSFFMGTDFANEDLVSENLDNHRYERQDDETIDGEEFYVVDAYPENKETKKNTGYSHRRLYVRKDIMMETIVKYFERRSGKHVKTMTVEEVEEVGGGAWRAKVSLMENHKGNHKTRSITKSWDFSDDSVSPRVFKHRYLKSKKHMK